MAGIVAVFVSLAVPCLLRLVAIRIVVRAPKPVDAQSRFAPIADRVTAFVLQRRPTGPETDAPEQ